MFVFFCVCVVFFVLFCFFWCSFRSKGFVRFVFRLFRICFGIVQIREKENEFLVFELIRFSRVCKGQFWGIPSWLTHENGNPV